MDSEKLKASLGRTIRTQRSELGYSQDGFAAEIGVHRTYMGGIERGERNVSLVNLNLIAAGLDLPLSALFKLVEKEYNSKLRKRSK